tara:strand:- start:565 stop:1794 length:1230 start_codon:yes stop_codon:yes gene_type:complete
LINCYICSDAATPLINLGNSPKSNFYADSFESSKKETFPLELFSCSKCCHLQLANHITPEKLFKNYTYVSGTTKTLKDYFKIIAECCMESIRPNSVLDVASNDGSFLKAFDEYKPKKIKLSGIDPAENLRSSYPNHIEITTGFLEKKTELGKNFDFISAQNVVAHTPSPISLLQGIEKHMHDDSILLLQTSQAFMLPKCQFDTVYHEHYSYFSLRSIEIALLKVNLKIVETMIADIHGQSLVNIITKKNSSSIKARKISLRLMMRKSFRKLTEREKFQLYNQKIFIKQLSNFDYLIKEMKKKFKIWSHKNKDSKFVIVGSAAKAVTWMITVGLQPELIIDENPLKINKFLPNCREPIKGMSDLHLQNTIFIIGAWNFYDEVKEKLIDQGLSNGNNSIVKFFPEFQMENL